MTKLTPLSHFKRSHAAPVPKTVFCYNYSGNCWHNLGKRGRSCGDFDKIWEFFRKLSFISLVKRYSCEVTTSALKLRWSVCERKPEITPHNYNKLYTRTNKFAEAEAVSIGSSFSHNLLPRNVHKIRFALKSIKSKGLGNFLIYLKNSCW